MLDIIEVFGAILCAVFHLLVRSIEFILVACTKGRSEARERFELRGQQQRDARGDAAARRARRQESEAHETRRSIATVAAAMIVFGVPVAALFAWHYHARLQARRTEATETQIARLADEFHDQVQDDERRTVSMRGELARLFPDAEVTFIDNAPHMIAWLEKNLEGVDLLCLDHDLGPNRLRDGQEFDPGTGRDVADFLAVRPPQCSVVIHSTNTIGADGMQFAMEDAGWSVARVHPIGDLEWIPRFWTPQIAAIIPIPRKSPTASDRFSRYFPTNPSEAE